MQKYLFAEISLDKKAYRLLEVVSNSEEEARDLLHHTLGVAYLATVPVRTAQPGVKSRLFRDREKWERFLDKFFLTGAAVDQRIREVLQ